MPATTPIRPLTGFGTVNGVPWLPDGFADVFDSTLVRVGEVELHTVQAARDGPYSSSAAGRRTGTCGASSCRA
ncbi:hypothetical protein ACWGDS_09605 [Streptomyces sp. NPDC055059]|uniref:hypothetical protein n=1 Tax=Streptomyces sp. NPDC127172 TaxID=3345382 RepID=UPI00363F0CBF